MSAVALEQQQFTPVERRVTFGGLLRSEWIKFWSVRSIVVTMAVAFVAIVGLGVLLAWATASSFADPETAQQMAAQGFDPVSASLQGAQMASLIVAAVGVIVIAGEFSTGMIRTSFAAAPGRLGVYAAKAVVLAVSVAVVMGVGVLLAFLLGQAVLEREGVGASLGDENVVRALLGHVAMLTGFALSGLAVGALLRNSAGAICTVLAAIFVVPLLLMAVPESWGGETIREYYFTNTTINALGVTDQSAYLEPAAGLALFAVWIAVLLGLGALVLKKRDV
ncbi:ABC transporter permease [Kineococcus sp. SYSU DK006]|uniref:ABC transporter permease n=1 Tax=Kineococcus sp. SYSU DK006 TaxID=3383127 RepID=UPI003D7C4A9B